MTVDSRGELMMDILVAVYRAVGTACTNRLHSIADAEAVRLGRDHWDALEALLLLQQRGHLAMFPDDDRGRLSPSGVWLARTLARA